jgi:cytochrome P450
MEVITTYCFDKNFNTVSYPDFAHPAMIGFHESNSALVAMRHIPFLRPILFNMPTWLTRRLSPGAMGRINFIKAVDAQISGILEDGSSLDRAEHEIIYHHLLNPKNEGENLSRKSLRDHAMSLVIGGTETVANTCVMATYHVLANSRIKERLKAELVEAWPDVDAAPISLERLEKLPYLVRSSQPVPPVNSQ